MGKLTIQHKANGSSAWRTIDSSESFPAAQKIARRYRKENCGNVRILDGSGQIVFSVNF